MILARSLDENLHTRHGPVRTFLILARYCSRTIFQEQMEIIRSTNGGALLWPPTNLWRLVRAWSAYFGVRVRLRVYEYWIGVKGSVV